MRDAASAAVNRDVGWLRWDPALVAVTVRARAVTGRYSRRHLSCPTHCLPHANVQLLATNSLVLHQRSIYIEYFYRWAQGWAGGLALERVGPGGADWAWTDAAVGGVGTADVFGGR